MYMYNIFHLHITTEQKKDVNKMFLNAIIFALKIYKYKKLLVSLCLETLSKHFFCGVSYFSHKYKKKYNEHNLYIW